MKLSEGESTALLPEEIINAQRQVRTDAYQMSIGEIVSMYDNHEIVISTPLPLEHRTKV
jgi:hypothetical protein